MRYSYHAEQWLFYPIDTLFAFFADPDNLPRLMPPSQRARIEKASLVPPPARSFFSPRIHAAAAGIAGSGSRITLSFRPVPHLPVRLKWVAEISEFAWLDRFSDRQVRGPFAYWNHCHSFQATSEGGIPRTLVTDHVNYELPFGPVGRCAHRLFLRKQIHETFAYRQSQLVKILGEITSKAA